MGGPIAPSDVTISTAGLNKVLEYEPRDLTISVGAGISYCELSRILAEHRQMIPLDPPFSDRATLSSELPWAASWRPIPAGRAGGCMAARATW